MHAQTLNLPSKRNVDLGTNPARPPGSLASRIPRRSVRHVYALSLSGDDPSPAPGNDVSNFERPPLEEARMRVNVATIPSSDRNCRHNVFIDNGGRLQKLDLPSTACVAVSQRFEARAGDTLSYDYVILLQATNGFTADRPAVRAVLVNHRTESAVSLMDRSIDRERITHPQRLGSRFRESQSFTVPTAGHYVFDRTPAPTFLDYIEAQQQDAASQPDAIRAELRQACADYARVKSETAATQLETQIADLIGSLQKATAASQSDQAANPIARKTSPPPIPIGQQKPLAASFEDNFVAANSFIDFCEQTAKGMR